MVLSAMWIRNLVYPVFSAFIFCIAGFYLLYTVINYFVNKRKAE